MKIYKDDYKHFRICRKLSWFLNAKNYALAKHLIEEKKIINFVELTHTKTSSKFKSNLITISDLDDDTFENNYNEEDDSEFYLGETIADGIETGHYAQEYFKVKYSCFNFESEPVNNVIEIINNKEYDVLFEPRFEYQGCVTKCDILKWNNDGWDLIEVKAVTWVKEEHMWDLLYQYDILTKCGIKVVNTYIMYLNNNYVKKEKIDLNELFIVNGSTWQKSPNTKKSFSLFESIQDEILNNNLKLQYENIKNIIKISDIDEIVKLLTLPYCHENSNQFCPHIFKYFSIHNTIFELYRLRKTKKALWYYEEDFLEINDERLLPFLTKSNLHLRQYDVIKNGEKLIDGNKFVDLKIEYKKYQYPIYMYDFETMKSAIPKFKNSKPYQQIPFQYSVHVLLAPDFDFKTYKSIKHYEFLADGNDDPREMLTKKLCHDLINIHGKGTYVAYNQSFEKSVLKKLAYYYPQYKNKLSLIHDGTIDLQDFFKEFKIYKEQFYGSLSIKKTLPAFEPSFSYEELVIKKGDMASEVFRRRVENNISLTNWIHNFRENMLKYCAQDTLGMVVLFWHVKNIIEMYKAKIEGENYEKI
ncbi:DUF2779 domain-containing protein [Spiroplasma endosymbiont of Dactylopius coccus]